MEHTTTPPRTQRLGLWHRPEANYSFGLGANGSVIAVVGLVAVLLAFIPAQNRLRNVAATAVVAGVIVIGFVIRDKWDRSLYAIARFETGWAWHRATGRTFFAPTWFSSSPVSKSSLPGLLSDVSIAEQVVNGVEYGVIIQPVSESATVVFECQPLGSAMSTEAEIAELEQRWHRWLGSICQEAEVLSVQVVTEAAGGDAEQLRLALQNLIKREDSKGAQLLESVASTISPTDRPVCRTWTAISWKSRRKDLHHKILPARIERIGTDLAECGAGSVRVLSKNEICRVWASMWDPDRRESLARWPDQVIHLRDVAPVTKEHRNHLAIGGYDALTLSMGTMPQGIVGTHSLQQLAQGVPGATTTRWAELWRPVRPTEARQWLNGIERGLETRLALTQNRRRQRVQDEVDEDHHRTTATALVEGANLVRFGFAVTATIPMGVDRTDVTERIRQLCGPFSVQLRVQNGAHMPAFIATLPGGIPLPEVVQSPDAATMQSDDMTVAP